MSYMPGRLRNGLYVEHFNFFDNVCRPQYSCRAKAIGAFRGTNLAPFSVHRLGRVVDKAVAPSSISFLTHILGICKFVVQSIHMSEPHRGV